MTAITTINTAQFEDRVFFTLTPHRYGNRAKVKSAEAHREYLRLKDLPLESTEANGNGATYTPSKQGSKVDKTSSTKELIDCKELDAINAFLSEIKDQLVGKIRGICNPSFISRGIYSMRKVDVKKAEKILTDAVSKLNLELRPAFVAAYPGAKDRAERLPCNRGGLGPIYCEDDYVEPSEAGSRFSIDWAYLELGIPKDLPDELRAQKEAELAAKIQDAKEEIVFALRESFQELIAHATDKLTVNPGEKPKVFRDSLIGNIDDFLAVFESRNMGDQALADLVAKARAIIRPDGKELIDVDRLRKFASFRDGIQNQFAGIKTALDGMITERKSRKIDLSED